MWEYRSNWHFCEVHREAGGDFGVVKRCERDLNKQGSLMSRSSVLCGQIPLQSSRPACFVMTESEALWARDPKTWWLWISFSSVQFLLEMESPFHNPSQQNKNRAHRVFMQSFRDTVCLSSVFPEGLQLRRVCGSAWCSVCRLGISVAGEASSSSEAAKRRRRLS